MNNDQTDRRDRRSSVPPLRGPTCSGQAEVTRKTENARPLRSDVPLLLNYCGQYMGCDELVRGALAEDAGSEHIRMVVSGTRLVPEAAVTAAWTPADARALLGLKSLDGDRLLLGNQSVTQNDMRQVKSLAPRSSRRTVWDKMLNLAPLLLLLLEKLTGRG